MVPKTKVIALILPFCFLFLTPLTSSAQEYRVPVTVEKAVTGAPQLLGIPIPQGQLTTADHVRVLNAGGEEIPSQITEVTSWAPADPSSIKWIWVFFFSGSGADYTVEYGPDVRNGRLYEQTVYVKNNQRSYGEVIVDTGPLRFMIERGGSGFFDRVQLDTGGDGFGEEDVIAGGRQGRGSFLDLLDDAGPDRSRAVITKTVKELGTGPLHAIIRIEGEYRYERSDNNPAPFITRIHAYAGKPFVKVLHTITYTGEPDKHTPVEGEYEAIATRDGPIKDEEALEGDPGWTQPQDQIEAAGLSLKYNFSGELTYRSSYRTGPWHSPGATRPVSGKLSGVQELSLFQTGPKPNRVPPVPNSTATEQLSAGYSATLSAGGDEDFAAERATGWIDISDSRWGVTLGIRHFFQEYPKELNMIRGDSTLTAYLWSPKATPMGFVRADGEGDSGMIANFAQGLTKTTELVYNFHASGSSPADLSRVADYVLDPPATHAAPSWYASSGAWGPMAARSDRYASYERGLDYKLDWMLYNQHWEPWYGMWDFGDMKAYYYRNNWYQWTNNEPAGDFMWWLQYMRTGNRDYWLAAQAASRHSMDIDNIHWPQDPEYIGDTNESLHWFQVKNQPPGSPYVGMGRRHASQQWTSQLSAHVWIAGWIASYYLDGYHRGLEVAELTGRYYIKRVFGEHGLRGRRLYLSVWNLAELWDATKKHEYRRELEARIRKMLALQKDADQAGSLVINRYGYAQVYASLGLGRYWRMTGDEEVRRALVTHARRVRDVPPQNHDMESYLSSISSLVLGYELSGDQSYLDEAIARARYLRTDRLSQAPQAYPDQGSLGEALEGVSHLPDDEGGFRPAIWKISNGMRVYGWTHSYNVPWLLYWMDQQDRPADE